VCEDMRGDVFDVVRQHEVAAGDCSAGLRRVQQTQRAARGCAQGDVNVVEVYVGYVRRKIDIPFGTNTIETIRGMGYRLESGAYVNGN